MNFNNGRTGIFYSILFSTLLLFLILTYQQTLSSELSNHQEMINIKRIQQLFRTDLKLLSLLKAQNFLFSIAKGPSQSRIQKAYQIEQQQIQQNQDYIAKFIHSQAVKDISSINFEQSKKGNLSIIKNPQLIKRLQERQIFQLFPVQLRTYQAIYEGTDIIVSDRTGSGKTIAYSLPVIDKMVNDMKNAGQIRKKRSVDPAFLIMVPTRQLAKQVQKQILSLLPRYSDKFRKIQVVALFGGSSISDQISQLTSGADIVVATPGRLIDMIKNSRINLQNIQTFCLDEADQMLAKGFQDDIEQIIQAIKQAKDRLPQTILKKGISNQYQTLLFSATIQKWVLKISQEYMNPDKKVFNLVEEGQQKSTRTSTTVQHLAIEVRRTNNEQIIDILNTLIQCYANKGEGRTIIFSKTKRQTSELAAQMQNALALHGDISQRDRQNNLDRFSSDKHGKSSKILIATDVASRGLDIPNVQLIIQIQPPQQAESYIHRSGRTGRMGRHGKSITLFNKNNFQDLMEIQKHARIQIRQICLPSMNTDQNIISDVVQGIMAMNPNKFSKTKETIVRGIKNELIGSFQSKGIKAEHSLDKVISYFIFENSRDLGKSLLAQFSTRSLINPQDHNAVTFILKPAENSKQNKLEQKQVLQYLKKYLPVRSQEKIQRTIKKGANNENNLIFDIQADDLSQVTTILAMQQALKDKYQIRKAKAHDVTLPFISNHRYATLFKDQGSYNRSYGQTSFGNRDNRRTSRPFASSSSWGNDRNKQRRDSSRDNWNDNRQERRNSKFGQRNQGQKNKWRNQSRQQESRSRNDFFDF